MKISQAPQLQMYSWLKAKIEFKGNYFFHLLSLNRSISLTIFNQAWSFCFISHFEVKNRESVIFSIAIGTYLLSNKPLVQISQNLFEIIEWVDKFIIVFYIIVFSRLEISFWNVFNQNEIVGKTKLFFNCQIIKKKRVVFLFSENTFSTNGFCCWHLNSNFNPIFKLFNLWTKIIF